MLKVVTIFALSSNEQVKKVVKRTIGEVVVEIESLLIEQDHINNAQANSSNSPWYGNKMRLQRPLDYEQQLCTWLCHSKELN